MKASIASVGPYRIEEEVGRGGMATVYRAIRTSTHGTDQVVAVKVLDAELANDPHHVDTFHAEAELSQRLGHRTLVPVLDHGTAEGVHFMVMEFIEGETLSALRRRYGRRAKGFPLGHALYVLAEVLDGLQYAHELRDAEGRPEHLVHRDVSPRNILVTRTGAVRLLDFGIARFESRPGTTQVGLVKGTVPYMAPEQAVAAPLDRRADIFAVGVILHELVTGETVVEDGTTDAQRHALAGLKLTPQWKKVPLPLRPVLERAIAPSAEQRWNTAAEFAGALRQAIHVLEPDHDPFLLGGLVEGLRPRPKPDPAPEPMVVPAKRRRVARRSAPEWLRAAVAEHLAALDAHGSAGAREAMAFGVAPALGMLALLLTLSGLAYTFITAV